MKGRRIVQLVFGLLGAVYTIVGVVCLCLAVKAAGALSGIFALPEDELAFAVVGTVFGGLGVIFLAVTLLLELSLRRQARLRDELLTWGQRAAGTVMDVRVNRSIRVNGRSPLVAWVRVSFPSGEVTLKSQNLWKACPAIGDAAEVLFDPMDERRYVILFPDE